MSRAAIDPSRPACTITGDGRLPAHGRSGSRRGDSASTGAVLLPTPDLLVLQGFRPDYRVAGTLTRQRQQIGDAVPPPLAAALLGSLLGIDWRPAVAEYLQEARHTDSQIEVEPEPRR